MYIQSLLYILISLFSSPLWATDYYISPTGSDSSAGTLSAPFKTISRANSLLKAGDRIILRKGLYREDVIISKSGTSSAPITIMNYQNEEAEVTGARWISGWKQDSGNIYTATIASKPAKISQVFVDDGPLLEARFPKDDNFLRVTGSSSSKTQFMSTDLPSQDLIGSTLVVRTYNWQIDDLKISNVNGSSVTLSSNASAPIDIGMKFYLMGKKWMLSRPGEWFYDSVTGQLSVWLPDGSNPQNVKLEAALGNPITLQNVSNVIVKGLKLTKSQDQAVNVISPSYPNNTNGNYLLGLNISYPGKYGIYSRNSEYLTISGNKILYTQEDAIYINAYLKTVISSNFIQESGTYNARFNRPKFSKGAINASMALNTTIKSNYISGAGYAGVVYGRLANVAQNYIENACFVLNDCGAIYTWNGSNSRITNDSTIDSNIIVGTRGGLTMAQDGMIKIGFGIYLDDFTNTVKVTKNTLKNNSQGLYLHTSWSVTVQGNFFYNNIDYQILYVKEYEVGTDGQVINPTDNNISGNQFIYGPNSMALNFRGSNVDGTPIMTFNDNDYFLASSKNFARDIGNAMNYSYSNWKKLNQDTSSRMNSWGSNLNMAYASTSSPELLANLNWNLWSSDSKASRSPSLITASSGNTFYSSAVFPLEKNKTYVLSYQVQAPHFVSYQTVIRRNQSPYDTLGLNRTMIADSSPQTVQIIFTASEDTPDARLDLQLSNYAQISVSNFRLRMIDMNTLDPATNLVQNSNFDAGANGWRVWCNNNQPNFLIMQNPTYGNFASFKQNASCMLSSQPFSIKEGSHYVIKGVANSDSPLWLGYVVRFNTFPWDSIGFGYQYTTSTWSSSLIEFTSAVSTTNNARLDIHTTPNIESNVTGLGVYEIGAVAHPDIELLSPILSNPSQSEAYFDCPQANNPVACDQYQDISGNAVSFPIKVPANSSKVVFWSASPFHQ